LARNVYEKGKSTTAKWESEDGNQKKDSDKQSDTKTGNGAAYATGGQLQREGTQTGRSSNRSRNDDRHNRDDNGA